MISPRAHAPRSPSSVSFSGRLAFSLAVPAFFGGSLLALFQPVAPRCRDPGHCDPALRPPRLDSLDSVLFACVFADNRRCPRSSPGAHPSREVSSSPSAAPVVLWSSSQRPHWASAARVLLWTKHRPPAALPYTRIRPGRSFSARSRRGPRSCPVQGAHLRPIQRHLLPYSPTRASESRPPTDSWSAKGQSAQPVPPHRTSVTHRSLLLTLSHLPVRACGSSCRLSSRSLAQNSLRPSDPCGSGSSSPLPPLPTSCPCPHCRLTSALHQLSHLSDRPGPSIPRPRSTPDRTRSSNPGPSPTLPSPSRQRRARAYVTCALATLSLLPLASHHPTSRLVLHLLAFSSVLGVVRGKPVSSSGSASPSLSPPIHSPVDACANHPPLAAAVGPPQCPWRAFRVQGCLRPRSSSRLMASSSLQLSSPNPQQPPTALTMHVRGMRLSSAPYTFALPQYDLPRPPLLPAGGPTRLSLKSASSGRRHSFPRPKSRRGLEQASHSRRVRYATPSGDHDPVRLLTRAHWGVPRSSDDPLRPPACAPPD